MVTRNLIVVITSQNLTNHVILQLMTSLVYPEVVAGHVLTLVTLLRESLATSFTPERFYLQMDYLEVSVVLTLAALAIEHSRTDVTFPLRHVY